MLSPSELGEPAESTPVARSFHDPLTGLPSREHFLERARAALTRAGPKKSCVAVAFVDIDRLGRINSMLGYEAGDRLLCEFVTRLALNVRPTDTVARLGGDNFALLYGAMAHEGDALTVVGRLQAAMEEPFAIDEREIFLTASAGIATASSGEGGVQPPCSAWRRRA